MLSWEGIGYCKHHYEERRDEHNYWRAWRIWGRVVEKIPEEALDRMEREGRRR